MKTAKKVISLFLSLLLVFSLMAPVVNVEAAYENDLPIIYVKGNGRVVYNKKGKQINPTPSLTNRINENKSEILKAYAQSSLKNDWSYLTKALREIIDPVFSELVLDNNGNVTNGSYPQKSATPIKKKSGYSLADYSFEFDPRIDPNVTATQLQKYINDVLAATGKKKVQLVSRCMGTVITAAYLTKYGSSKVDTCVLYAGALKGLLSVSAAFAGDFDIDYTALRQYSETNMNSEYSSLIQALTLVMQILDPAGFAKGLVSTKMQKIAKEIMPELILATYGTMPAYWAMVSEEYYNDAKSFVFGNQTSKYAGLIKKIDNYQFNVQRKIDSTLKSCQKNGMKVAVISKYNVSLPPLFTYAKQQADGTVELNKMSLGATCADLEHSLSTNYLEYLYTNGKDNYLSKDQIIDASTCLFPDYTWFVKDIDHDTWASSINSLIYAILHSKDQYTINTNTKKYPQFLQYSQSDKVTPITTGTTSLARTNPTVTAYALGTTTYAYNGQDKKPYPIVRDHDGNSLKKGRDYTITYDSNCSSIGTHKATIKMTGYYSGSKTLTYKILPATVSNLKANTTVNSIKLTWSKVTGATGYRVQRYNASSGEWVTLTNTKSTTYTNSNLPTNKEYKYRVAAYVTTGGKTVFGSNASVTAKTVPDKVTGLKATGTPNSVKLTWTKVSGVSGYQVQRYNSSTKKWVNLATTTNNYYTNSSLPINATYQYRVVSYKTVNGAKYYGASSATVSAKTIPAKVTGLKAAQTTSSVTLSWSKVAGATGYRVYKYDSAKKVWINVTDTKNTKYSFNKLSAGTTYKYAVRSYTNSGGSAYWSEASTYLTTATKPATPTLKVTADTKQATLSWGKINGATGYVIYYSTSKNGTYKQLASTKSTSYTAKKLTSGKTYYFKVAAYKTVDSKNVYSAYSAIKNANVK